MSNLAYLASSSFSGIYPSAQAKGYKPEKQTVACAIECVPLLWLALFRDADLTTETIATDDGDVTVTAPVTTLAKGLKQLSAAIPRLEAVFAKSGSLGLHAALLKQALQEPGGKYITIELDEIAALASSRKAFDKQVRDALQALDKGTPAEAKKRLVKVSQVDARRTFLAPAELMAQQKPAAADLVNLERLLGTEHFRPVPWETAPPPKKPSAEVRRQNELLLDAIAKGNLAKVRQALDAGANPDCKGQQGRCAIDWAAEKGKAPIVKALLAAGASLEDGEAIVTAASEGKADIVPLLVENGLPPGSERALAFAASRGHQKIVAILLDVGTPASYSHDPPGHPLNAVSEGRLPISFLPQLIKAGAEANQSHALGLAAARGNLEAARALLLHGADIEKKRYGMPPVASAAYGGHEAVVRFLVAAGTSVGSIKDAIKQTRLAIETDAKIQNRKPDKQAQQLLRRRQAILAYLESLAEVRQPLPLRRKPTPQDVDAFYKAVMSGDTTKVGVMMKEFPKIMNSFAWTPLFQLAQQGKVEMLQFLLEQRLNPNERNHHGNTPLHFAAQHKQAKAVEVLLKYGANPKIQDADGDTPLSLAKGEAKAILEKHLARDKQ